jgi:asparagine synthase (glutamine-hydrolysing)
LREAFAGTGLLPDEVLYRKKEAFSDGISQSASRTRGLKEDASGQPKADQGAAPRERKESRSWFEIIQAWVEDKVTDEELSMAAITYPHCPPTTKEAYYYRRLFCESVGANRQTIIPAYWQPKWSADGKEVTGYVDPSARTLTVYSDNK